MALNQRYFVPVDQPQRATWSLYRAVGNPMVLVSKADDTALAVLSFVTLGKGQTFIQQRPTDGTVNDAAHFQGILNTNQQPFGLVMTNCTPDFLQFNLIKNNQQTLNAVNVLHPGQSYLVECDKADQHAMILNAVADATKTVRSVETASGGIAEKTDGTYLHINVMPVSNNAPLCALFTAGTEWRATPFLFLSQETVKAVRSNREEREAVKVAAERAANAQRHAEQQRQQAELQSRSRYTRYRDGQESEPEGLSMERVLERSKRLDNLSDGVDNFSHVKQKKKGSVCKGDRTKFGVTKAAKGGGSSFFGAMKNVFRGGPAPSAAAARSLGGPVVEEHCDEMMDAEGDEAMDGSDDESFDLSTVSRQKMDMARPATINKGEKRIDERTQAIELPFDPSIISAQCILCLSIMEGLTFSALTEDILNQAACTALQEKITKQFMGQRVFKEDECVICTDSLTQGLIFYTCGHACTCVGCASSLLQCPICRGLIVARTALTV